MSSLEKTFNKGSVIIKEGGFSNSFYIIRKGSVEVVKRREDREVRLATYGPGDFFGEVSLLDPQYSKHSATIRALEETTVTIMGKDDFEKYIGHLTPGVKNLLRKMAIYLRETSQRVDSDEEAEKKPEKAVAPPKAKNKKPPKEPSPPEKTA